MVRPEHRAGLPGHGLDDRAGRPHRIDQADTLPRRLGVSVRTLHALFAGGGSSFAGTVRRFRLDRARWALADPALAHLRVIDIAADAGFGRVAGFHRSFRREFGLTPGEIRPDSPAGSA